MSEAATKDAGDCARYLASLRDDPDGKRFKAAIDDFLARHKDAGLSIGTLRQLLADAYVSAAPEDVSGHQRILGRNQ